MQSANENAQDDISQMENSKKQATHEQAFFEIVLLKEEVAASEGRCADLVEVVEKERSAHRIRVQGVERELSELGFGLEEERSFHVDEVRQLEGVHNAMLADMEAVESEVNRVQAISEDTAATLKRETARWERDRVEFTSMNASRELSWLAEKTVLEAANNALERRLTDNLALTESESPAVAEGLVVKEELKQVLLQTTRALEEKIAEVIRLQGSTEGLRKQVKRLQTENTEATSAPGGGQAVNEQAAAEVERAKQADRTDCHLKEVERWRDRLATSENQARDAAERASDAELDLAERLDRCDALEASNAAMGERCRVLDHKLSTLEVGCSLLLCFALVTT